MRLRARLHRQRELEVRALGDARLLADQPLGARRDGQVATGLDAGRDGERRRQVDLALVAVVDQRPGGQRVGAGHWIGPAVTPAGSFHSIVVGSPESPGFCQYVCQPSRILRRSATVAGAPGAADVAAETSSASTFGVRTGAACAPRAREKASAARIDGRSTKLRVGMGKA
jgi:hypothetical protein